MADVLPGVEKVVEIELTAADRCQTLLGMETAAKTVTARWH